MKVKFLFLFIYFVFISTLFSQEINDSCRTFIYFPKEIPKWDLRYTLGFTLAYIPKAIVEEEIYYSPLADLNIRFGLPYDFSAHGRISSIGISNNFVFGGQWSHSFGKFSFALGYDWGYWLGFLKVKGFDVVANGFINYPGLTIGLDLSDFYVSLKGELLWLTFNQTFTGENSVGGVMRELVGSAITYALEQPLWKKNYIAMGVKLYYTKFFYQSWVSFSTFDRMLFFPEFFVGFIL
jgi:hypothetical protein